MNDHREPLNQQCKSECNRELAACYLRSYAGRTRKLARSKALENKPRITTKLDNHANALAKVAEIILS